MWVVVILANDDLGSLDLGGGGGKECERCIFAMKMNERTSSALWPNMCGVLKSVPLKKKFITRGFFINFSLPNLCCTRKFHV